MLLVIPHAGPSYCGTCDVSTGDPVPHGKERGWMWQRADGCVVLELFLDHSAVHAPSPA